MSAVFNDPIAITGLADFFPNNSKTFKQLQVEMTLEIPPEKPEIEHILHEIIDVNILETFVIETPCSKSHEGQILTGKKLIINGEILQKVEYVADNSTQSVHASEFSTKFSTYITLDDSNCKSYTYKVNAYVEDVYIKQLDRRRIFKNVTMLLDSVPINTELPGSPCFEYESANEKEIYIDNQYDRICMQMPKRFFSQFCCSETVVISRLKPDIEQIVSVIIDPEIVSVKFINTMKGTSAEGQHLSGKKAIIEIKCKQKILYAADCPDQSIYGLESIFYKSAYIVLPLLIEGTEPELLYKSEMLKIKLNIEDIHSARQDKRRIFENICLLAEIQLLPTYEVCYSSYQNCARSELFLCFEDGSCNTQITKNKLHKNIKPSWSPNGSQIAYLCGAHDGYSLYSFNIKNNNRQILIPHEVFENISSFSWLKDSQHIIFSALKNGSKDLYLFNIADNMCRQITQGAGLIKSYYPKAAPDGCKVAYLRSSTCMVDLWYSDIYGKNPRKLTNTGAVRDFDWLADSEGFVYIDNKNEERCELYIIKLDEQHPSLIISSDSLYGCKAIAVSPDGDYFAFIGTNKCSDDIYVYDINKRKLCNITNHHDSIKINSLAWKIDSNKIYYAAKEFMSFDICCVDIESQHKERLTNTDSSYMQLAYRPRIK